MEKVLTVTCLCAGSILTYMAGSDIYWSAGIAPLVAYTIAILLVGAGVRAVLKG